MKKDRSVAGPATGVTVYQLRVTLRDISPLVWRRLLVHSDTTIAQLHEVLQIAMGWEDVHLQQFLIHGKAYGVYHDGGITFADDPRQVRLADFRLRQGEHFLYEYDFGDGWQHDIWLEQALPLDERRSYPACTANHGACPRKRAEALGCGEAAVRGRDNCMVFAACTQVVYVQRHTYSMLL